MNTHPQLFGTDGIRGTFGSYPLDESTVRRLGLVLARRLAERHPEPRVVLGGDTRASTPVLSHWLAAGLAAGGAGCTYLGTVPTPAVAYLTRSLGAAGGVAISASHNPHPDNGIKLLDGDGFKWPSAAEAELEARLRASTDAGGSAAAADLRVDDRVVAAYLDALAGALPGERPLAGLAVALDAGHGAASPYARELFARLGAGVTLIAAEPDGRNINEGCGSTHPEKIAQLTRENRSDLGFAFDGDADRVIFVDETGRIRDGDAILYLWGRDLQHRGRLPGSRLVATSMSNMGLEAALGREGIELVRCDVGDREVVRTMRREGIELGGEQSGHIVSLSLSTTGDGLLSALQIAHLRVRAGRPISELVRGFEPYPQLIRNVRVQRKPDLESLPKVRDARDGVVRQLAGEGRLVLRYSGTEPLVRIMIEGREHAFVDALAERLASVIAEELS
ncbi:MAG: phosphoglucosamine mutase [bacterium]|nr:phosphoglucosamine mutase [bacterium]